MYAPKIVHAWHATHLTMQNTDLLNKHHTHTHNSKWFGMPHLQWFFKINQFVFNIDFPPEGISATYEKYIQSVYVCDVLVTPHPAMQSVVNKNFCRPLAWPADGAAAKYLSLSFFLFISKHRDPNRELRKLGAGGELCVCGRPGVFGNERGRWWRSIVWRGSWSIMKSTGVGTNWFGCGHWVRSVSHTFKFIEKNVWIQFGRIDQWIVVLVMK